ncbi:MAG TPA: hypothetical protein DD670_12600, partial [Planctomycetaceae bacterium]|nr:hypothetical protein [Planctomycetaceae bacterium]
MSVSLESSWSRGLDRVERWTCFVMSVALAVLVVGVNLQVAVRWLLCRMPEEAHGLVYLLSGTQELVQYAFVWMIFLGAGVGVRRGLHLRINFLDSSLSERGRRSMAILVDLGCLVLAAIFIVAGCMVAWRTRLHLSP